jgi:TolB-like protein
LESLAAKDILSQVARICSCSDLKTKKLLCRFLKFIVNETLRGRGDQLKGYTIGISVFGKEPDFDPEQDSLVRIHAGRLRRSLKLYYLLEGKNDPIIIEIPKGSYQPKFSFSNSGGNQGEKHSISGEHAQAAPKMEASIAVLPFSNLSGDPNIEYFAFGISEELSIELNKYEDIQVIHCWKRPDFDTINGRVISEIGARFVLDGSVQKHQNQYKVHALLIDSSDGTQLWSQQYYVDSTNDGFFKSVENICDGIAKSIGSEFGYILRYLKDGIDINDSKNLNVLEAKLRYYYYEAHMSPELGKSTLSYIQQVLRQTPDSASLLAMAAAIIGVGYAFDQPGTSLDKMDELVDRALELDKNCQIVRLGNLIRHFLKNNKSDFFREAEYCLSLGLSSPFRLGTIGHFIALYGDWERGKNILDKAMNKQIGYPPHFHGGTCAYYYRKNDFEKALREAYKFELPGLFWGKLYVLACLGQLKRKTNVKDEIIKLKKLKPDFEEKAYILINRFIKEEELVIKLLEGLKKAGLKVSIHET